MRFTGLLVALVFTSSVVRAECYYSTDIVKTPDGRYSYSKECHIEVGANLQKLELYEKQVEELEHQLNLKDLRLKLEQDRANLWLTTASELNSKVEHLERMEKQNKWLYFGLGVLATGVAIWGTNQLRD